MTETLPGVLTPIAQRNDGEVVHARHLVEMLRRHYLPEGRPPGGVFAPEIGSPCGKRRADAIWMPTTVAGGKGELRGHEIKVTRADLLTELDDPTKAEPWAQYCTRWWLVVAHPGLIAGLDIPPAWGVMAPPSGRRTRSMTVLVPAPELKPREPAPGVARLAAWQLYTQNDRILQLQREDAYQKKTIEQLRREVDELRAGGARPESPEAARVARILAGVNDRALSGMHLWGSASNDDIIAAIVDHVATRDAAREMRQGARLLVSQVQRIVKDPLGHALRELEKADAIARDLDGGTA